MKTNYKSTTALLLFMMGGIFSGFSQKSDNPFLDRDYWASQPSIGEIDANIVQGHSVTEANGGGFDATTFAIFANNPVTTINHLIEKGNDVNKKTHDSRTYIFWSASRGNLELMEYFIGKGANLNLKDSHGYSPSSFAAASGQLDLKVYELFIKNGSDLKNEKDHHGANILLVAAARAKDLKLVDFLISIGLDINTTDDDGNGIFNYAAKGGNISVLKTLNERGVSIKKSDKTGENAILFASSGGGRGSSIGIEVFEYLEGIGVAPNVVAKNGVTPIHNLSRSSSDIKIFDYFIAKGVDPNAKDQEGNTAFLNSISRNKLETISYFTEKTKDINQTNNDGQSALALAIQNNSAEVVNYLISKGAKTDVLDKDGNNLAYYLFETRGNPKDFDSKVQALTKAGFNFKSPQADKSTIWHLAVGKNNIDLLKKVSGFGADINAKDSQGNTPLLNAAMKTNNTEILKYLIANGADIKSTTEFGETVLDLAKENELLAKSNSSLDFLN
ncbi:ankyrin repeat domain-containing protein [Aurantibacter crassamenti]|uniref:ankyrin repeat domain-containing protein n=1 Tax=Aurantibacter crassamenti TaxID=1837375 RepID=UPI00193929CB|nr:ankyrin repeat domain-containing protein [Aurantibacter crassamenti]MBM1106626.1 ankyrin repeat domain-containing protein [Aurantibacter crassamenti]